MQLKLIIATIAASAVSGVLAAPAPNNNIAAREQNAKMAEMTQLSDLAKQEGQLLHEMHDKLGAKYLELKEKASKDHNDKTPTLGDIDALKQHMLQQKQKRDANPEADPEAWGWDYGFEWGFSFGWQEGWPFTIYPWLYDWNYCNYATGFGFYNAQFGYAAGYAW